MRKSTAVPVRERPALAVSGQPQLSRRGVVIRLNDTADKVVVTPRIDWRSALRYVAADPSWKRRVAVGGLLMLLVPPVGWILALGYRSLVGNRIVDRCSPLLPAWRGNLMLITRRGAASSGVILVYLAPFLVGYWLCGARSVRVFTQQWRELAGFVTAIVVFPPLAIPTLPVVYALRYDWLQFSLIEIALLLCVFLGAILLLPAAFLQVPRHRCFRAAFNVRKAWRLVAAAPRLYVEAWIGALAVSAVAVIILPLAPWLLFWSYLVISHLFLQVLTATLPLLTRLPPDVDLSLVEGRRQPAGSPVA